MAVDASAGAGFALLDRARLCADVRAGVKRRVAVSVVEPGCGWHAALWWLSDDERFGTIVEEQITDQTNPS